MAYTKLDGSSIARTFGVPSTPNHYLNEKMTELMDSQPLVNPSVPGSTTGSIPNTIGRGDGTEAPPATPPQDPATLAEAAAPSMPSININLAPVGGGMPMPTSGGVDTSGFNPQGDIDAFRQRSDQILSKFPEQGAPIEASPEFLEMLKQLSKLPPSELAQIDTEALFAQFQGFDPTVDPDSVANFDQGFVDLLKGRIEGEGVMEFDELKQNIFDPQSNLLDAQFDRAIDRTLENLSSRGLLDSGETRNTVKDLETDLAMQKGALLGSLSLEHAKMMQDSIQNAIQTFGVLEGQRVQSKTTITAANIDAATRIHGMLLSNAVAVAQSNLSAEASMNESRLAARTSLQGQRMGALADIEGQEIAAASSERNARLSAFTDLLGQQIGAEASLTGAKIGADASILGDQIRADASVTAAGLSANATVQAAQISAQAALQRAGMDYDIAMRALDQELSMKGIDPVKFETDPGYRQDTLMRRAYIETVKEQLIIAEALERGLDIAEGGQISA